MCFAAGYGFWLSATDINQTAGHFHWSDGTRVDDTLWKGGQPDDFGTGEQTCSVLDTGNAKLFDDSCSAATYNVLCEVSEALSNCL